MLFVFFKLTKTILQNTISRCEMPQPNLASIQVIKECVHKYNPYFDPT